MMIVSIILSLILTGLGILHFGWAAGWEKGFSQSLPTKENGERVLHPGKWDSAIVGMGLTACGVFYLLKAGVIEYPLPGWIMTSAGWLIPPLFLMRAIGEFNYVGFFKKVKNTEFGKWDTMLFSPLCLAIGLMGISISLINGR